MGKCGDNTSNSTTLKKCISCKKEKPTKEFSKDKTRSDGLDPRCSECNKQRKLETYKRKKSLFKNQKVHGNTKKRCISCNKNLSVKNFGKNPSTKDGLKPYCKPCAELKRVEWGRTSMGAAKLMLSRMKRRSKAKGFPPPSFTVEEIVDVIENGKCNVTNRSFDFNYKSKYKNNPFAASPDRLDSSKPYSKENTQFVMSWVNLAKNQWDMDFFKELLKGIRL